MPAIDLTGIYSRPYSDSEEPTTYGPDDHTSGTGAIDLSRIMLRPYEDNRLSSIGGSGIDDPDDGDDGGGDPGGGGEFEPGNPGDFVGEFALYTNQTTNVDNFAWKTFDPQLEIYAYMEIYISQAAIDAFTADSDIFGPEILDISYDGDPFNSLQGIFFTNRNQVNADDGNMYVWDYYSAAADKIQVTAGWHYAEIAYRVNGSNHWESNWKWDGVESGWDDGSPFFVDYPGELSSIDTVVTGAFFTNNQPIQWYIDNVVVSFDDWVSDGGTQEFMGDFESGDFSDWTGTEGTPGVGTPP